jgi:hypothetical protein
MLKLNFKIFLIAILFVGIEATQAQSFGFGCFGFVGGFAGYGYQKYEPGSFTEAITAYNNQLSIGSSQTIPEFGNAYGYRVGINFFRAKFSGSFISLKGYYEDLSENKSFLYDDGTETTNSALDFDIKSWNVGLDFGIPITDVLSWKIVEGTLHFNTAKTTFKPNIKDNSTDKKYSNDSPELGYSISTGLVFSIINNFVSLEGTAGYKFFKIKQMKDTEGNAFQIGSFGTGVIDNNDFIKSGGFTASVQLNIGFPL